MQTVNEFMLLNYEAANTDSKAHYINRSDSYGAQAEIAEILVFDRTLSLEEEQLITYYLSEKWGLESQIDSDSDGIADENDSDNPILLMDPVTYSLTNEPDGMSVDTNGLISWTPVNGVFDSGLVTLTIQDGLEDGTVPVSETFSITVAPVDDMPVFTSDPITSINEDSVYYYQVTAEDEDVGETAILSEDTIPNWLTFNASTGILEGTPTNDDVGDHNIILHSNSETGLVTQEYIVPVVNTNDIPVFTSPEITTGL